MAAERTKGTGDRQRIQDFSKGVTFVKGGGVTIHCLITKIRELGACFLYFSYMLSQNGGRLVTRSTLPGSSPGPS